jgi:hypothetical protein
MRDSTIVVRDLASGREVELAVPSLVKSGLAYSADSQSLFFLGTPESDELRSEIYRVSETAPPTPVVIGDGSKGAFVVDPSGAALVYALPQAGTLRRPASVPGGPAPDPDGGGRGRGGGPGGPQPAEGPRPNYAVADLTSGRVTTIRGSALTLSADGKTLAYVGRDGASNAVFAGPTLGPQVAVVRTAERIDAPALSPDGKRLAWQQFVHENWEVFVAEFAGGKLTAERRLTREIQHDVLPRFVTADRLLALIGEPRHRRSYLYDLGSDVGLTPVSDDRGIRPTTPLSDDKGVRPTSDPKRTKLFHNNTVRTIAPEYQWVASPDGTKLIIGAERDGDTVSPRRGVYLVDTTQTVTKADLIARLRRNLEAETKLRADGGRTFAPIAADVRQIVSRASVDRVYGYEHALFQFDSKNIRRPGNRQASEFLFNTYNSFGYEPEYQWLERRDAFGGRTANVVATLRGTVNPELVYVISSHYDSVEAGPGADDDTSGTAALLEAARVLAGKPQPATIVFASMTGEEGGLLGSREFVRLTVEKNVRVLGVLNNDMIGWMNDQRMDNTIRYSNPGIRDIQHAAATLFTSLITYDALYWKGTDAMSFYDVYGDVIGGIGSYPVLGNPNYHQATDLLDTVNHQLITETSKTTVATIMLLASSPSRLTGLKAERAGSDVTVSWNPSPEKGVSSYIVAYGPSDSPAQRRQTVSLPRITLSRVPAGTAIAVKAVNARGLEGWDWARVVAN